MTGGIELIMANYALLALLTYDSCAEVKLMGWCWLFCQWEKG